MTLGNDHRVAAAHAHPAAGHDWQFIGLEAIEQALARLEDKVLAAGLFAHADQARGLAHRVLQGFHATADRRMGRRLARLTEGLFRPQAARKHRQADPHNSIPETVDQHCWHRPAAKHGQPIRDHR